MGRLMSDAEIRHRKKVQGHVSQATGALGLAALGGTMAASRGGRNALRKIPQLKSKIKAPPPKDPNRDRIKGGITPVLATSAGLGGLGSFNFAAYTNAESRKRQQKMPVKKADDMGLDMGYFGDEGLQGVIEKAWEPSASTYSSERSRHKRGKAYEAGAVAAGGAGATVAGIEGTKAVKAAKKLKPIQMAGVHDATNFKGEKYRIAPTEPNAAKGFRGEEKAIPLKSLKAARGHAGKAGIGLAAVGGAAATHSALKRKRQGSWQSYGKRDTTSAFGIEHDTEWTAP